MIDLRPFQAQTDSRRDSARYEQERLYREAMKNFDFNDDNKAAVLIDGEETNKPFNK